MCHILTCSFRRKVRIIIYIRIFLPVNGPGFWIEVSIRAQSFVNKSTQHFINRFTHRFPTNIPESDFDSAQHSQQRNIRTHCVAAAVHSAPQRFYPEGIHSPHIALKYIFNHFDNHMRSESRALNLPKSFNTVIRSQFEKDEVTIAKVWWRISDHIRFQVFDFHAFRNQKTMMLRRAFPWFTSAIASLICSNG